MATTLNLDAYATLLCDYCLYLKPGDTLLIRSTTLAEPLLQAVYKVALERGANPEVELSFDKQNRIYYDHASDDTLDQSSPFYNHAITHFDALLNIRAPFNPRSLDGVPSEKKLRHAKALAPTKKTFMSRSASGELKWCLCVYPTEAAAKECGMTLAEYTDFVAQACFLNHEDPSEAWRDLGRQQQQFVEQLNAVSDIHIQGPNGTDIRFSTEGRTWINSDGKRNMPSGEVFTSPVEDSANGTIYFSYPTLYQGNDVEGVTLTYENGYLTDWKATIGQAALDEAFSIEGSRRVGELAIGTNSQIQRPTKIILFDEKIGGSIHMAVGASYPETGGKNESSLHWDMITDMRDGGKIWADGTLIYENGAFVES